MAPFVLQNQEMDFAVKLVLSLVILIKQFSNLLFVVSAGYVCLILSQVTFFLGDAAGE